MMSGKIRSLVWCPAKQKGAAIGPFFTLNRLRLIYPQFAAVVLLKTLEYEKKLVVRFFFFFNPLF
jgi:hypothetical protein